MQARRLARWLGAFLTLNALGVQAGEAITLAAASSLKPAVDALVADFRSARPQDRVETVYGASGTLLAQIRQGAPFDLFFSADLDYPRALVEQGGAGSEVRVYAVGRLVLWSASIDVSRMTLADLADARFGRIAIANPRTAPYGARAEQALRASAVWERVQDRLVYGENIAQAAQFVATGNATVGILARSLALEPALARGRYALIPDSLHQRLDHGFVLTRRGARQPLALAFANYVGSDPARSILHRAGFDPPGPAPGP